MADSRKTNGPLINVTIDLVNELQEPFFRCSHTLKDWPQNKLIHALEASADEDKRYQFSADYYAKMGYMITAINSLKMSSEQKTYWAIYSDMTGYLKVGVSTYVPQNNEKILFKFQHYGDQHDSCTD